MTPTPTNADDVTVRQEDRNAAADAVKAYRDRKNGDWQQRIRDGKCDDGEMVQAFARHRTAHQSTEVEREAIARAIRHSRNERKSPGFGYVCDDETIEEEWLKDADAILALFRTPPAPAGKEDERYVTVHEIDVAEAAIAKRLAFKPTSGPRVLATLACQAVARRRKQIEQSDTSQFTSGFIAGREAAARILDQLAAEEDEAIAGMDYSDANDRARCAIVAKEFRRAAKKVRAIEPREKGE